MDPVVTVLLVLLAFGLIEAMLLRSPLPDPWNWIAQVILLIVLLLVFLSWLVGVSEVEMPGRPRTPPR